MSRIICQKFITTILVITIIVSLNNNLQAAGYSVPFNIYHTISFNNTITDEIVVPVSFSGYDLIISSIYGAFEVSCSGASMIIDEPGTYHFNYYPSGASNHVAFTFVPDFSSSYMVCVSGSITPC